MDFSALQQAVWTLSVMIMVVLFAPGQMVGLLLNYSINDFWAFAKIAISISPVYIVVCIIGATLGSASDQWWFIVLYRIVCVLSFSVLAWMSYNAIKTFRYGFVQGETRVKVPTFKRLDLLGITKEGQAANPSQIYWAALITSSCNPYTICIFLSWLIMNDHLFFSAFSGKSGSISFLTILGVALASFVVAYAWVWVIYGFYGMLFFIGRDAFGPRFVKWALIICTACLILLAFDVIIKFILGPNVAAPGMNHPVQPYALTSGYLFHNVPILDIIF